MQSKIQTWTFPNHTPAHQTFSPPKLVASACLQVAQSTEKVL